jgi:hypothetical protein
MIASHGARGIGTRRLIGLLSGRELSNLMRVAFPELRAMAVCDSAIESAAPLATGVCSTVRLRPVSHDQ